MSDIGLIMNGLLGLLLVGALVVGWRLEGRLKALRASHQSFTEAVHDLDRAAARAEQGLADLRAATDEAAETLAGRIDRATQLAGRLERLTGEAASAEQRLAAAPAAPRPGPSRDVVASRFAERYGAMRTVRPVGAVAEAAARNDLILEDEPVAETPEPRVFRPANDRLERLRALAARPQAVPAAARRPVEDELFDAPEPRRAAAGGTR